MRRGESEYLTDCRSDGEEGSENENEYELERGVEEDDASILRN